MLASAVKPKYCNYPKTQIHSHNALAAVIRSIRVNPPRINPRLQEAKLLSKDHVRQAGVNSRVVTPSR